LQFKIAFSVCKLIIVALLIGKLAVCVRRGTLKMQEWKMWKQKMWENTARVEYAGLKMQEETAASVESQPHVGPGHPFPFLSIHFLIFYHFFLLSFLIRSLFLPHDAAMLARSWES